MAEKVTLDILAQKKNRGEKITSVTAYDYPSALLADRAGIEIVLAGDSVAMVWAGRPNTLEATLDEMIYHTRAVRRGIERALVLGDMPFGSYQVSDSEAVRNAVRLIKEGGAEAIKLEGGQQQAPLVERLVRAEIPVMGHIGLTPQSVNRMGGYRVQGRTLEAARRLLDDARALVAAGAFAIVLEGMPREIAARITNELPVPTIGIGAGPDCDGQVLVWHDLLGLNFDVQPKFARRYADLGAEIGRALERYIADVRSGAYPSDQESYHLAAAERDRMEQQGMLTTKPRLAQSGAR
jgi:3-methyl-2-oxobutanoate hydroxymethyltransferase